MPDAENTISGWLDTNTFHHSEFWDIQELLRAKREAGVTISLCVPTLNEEATIGKEVIVFKSELMDRYPFIDEFAVIDSGSSDRTLEIAASYGADTYLSADILPEHGDKPGKGENLWKAIHQLKGDIICYVDADIKNIHPKFVTGLVAPLLYRPEIQYVKAFYDRPLAVSEDVRPSGGGRVTEILVRPLFSMFFPELSALNHRIEDGKPSDVPGYAIDAARTLSLKSFFQSQAADLTAASVTLQELTVLAKSLQDSKNKEVAGEARELYLSAINRLGKIQLAQDQPEAALVLFREEIRLREDNPYDIEGRVALADAYSQAAKCLDTGDPTSRSLAIYYLEHAISLVGRLPTEIRNLESTQAKVLEYNDQLSIILEMEE